MTMITQKRKTLDSITPILATEIIAKLVQERARKLKSFLY